MANNTELVQVTTEVTYLCTACRWHNPENGKCSPYTEPRVDCSLTEIASYLSSNSYHGFIKIGTDNTDLEQLLVLVSQESDEGWD